MMAALAWFRAPNPTRDKVHDTKCTVFDTVTDAHSVFTCVGALAIAKRLDLVNQDLLGEWLAERQLPNGGLNGRPEKLEDVCYSWWVLSSLAMINRLHWIDREKLVAFILSCQVRLNFLPAVSWHLISYAWSSYNIHPVWCKLKAH